MSDVKIWFVKLEESIWGPFLMEDIRKMVETGELTGSDLVKQTDFGTYSRVDTFEMFRNELFKKTKEPQSDELSIFVDKSLAEQVTQTSVVSQSSEIKIELQQAEEIQKQAEREYAGMKIKNWIVAGILVLILVAGMCVTYFGKFI